MHDCISKVREDLMSEDPKIKYVRFKLDNIVNISDRSKGTKTGQAIEIGVEHTKRNGTIIIKEEKSFVTHNFCPFCGKKYSL